MADTYSQDDLARQREAKRARRRIRQNMRFTTAFWDNLSVVEATSLALDELDRRNKRVRLAMMDNTDADAATSIDQGQDLRADPALVEQRSSVMRGIDVKRFAMRGGPDMNAALRVRQADKANKRDPSPPTPIFAPAHPRFLKANVHFEQHLRDHSIYPINHRLPDGQQHIPEDYLEVREAVESTRDDDRYHERDAQGNIVNPMPSYGWGYNRVILYQDFIDPRSREEGRLNNREHRERFWGSLFPIILYPNVPLIQYEQLTQYRDIHPVTRPWVEPPFPDLVDGALRPELHPRARRDVRLMSLISIDDRAYRGPHTGVSDLILPNFVLDEGSDRMHLRYAGAHGARAMHAIGCLRRKLEVQRFRQAFGNNSSGPRGSHGNPDLAHLTQQDLDAPVPDKEALSFSAVFWRGSLSLFAHHIEDADAGHDEAPAADGLKPVFTTRIAHYDVADMDHPEDFRRGLESLANLRDLAMERRNKAIELLNEEYRLLGYGTVDNPL